MDGETLKSYVTHWPDQRWQEYEPLLSYCRDNSVRLIACGTPLKVSIWMIFLVQGYFDSVSRMNMVLISMDMFQL